MDKESLAALLARADQAVSAPAVVEAMPTVSAPELTGGDVATGFLRSAAAGPTFGLSQQLEAAARAPFTDLSYGEELANIRQQQRAFESEYPASALGTEIATGLLLNPLGALGAVGKGAQVISKSASAIPQVQRALQGARVAKALAPVGKTAEVLTELPILKTAKYLASTGAGQAGIESFIRAEGDLGEKAIEGIKGAGAGAVGGTILGGVSKAGQAMARGSKSLILSAYGITAPETSRIAKKAKMQGKGVQEIADMPIEETIRRLENQDILRVDDSDSRKILNLMAHQENIASDLNTLIKDADKVIEPVLDYQTKYSDKLVEGITGSQRKNYKKAVDRERQALLEQMEEFGGGTLENLQKLKIGLNRSWSSLSKGALNEVQRAARSDLREEIENRIAKAAEDGRLSGDAADRLIALNQEYGKTAELRDLFADKLGRKEPDVVEKLFKQVQTSGGAGQALIASAASGSPIPAALGLAASAVRVPQAKRELGTLLSEPLVQRGIAPVADVLQILPKQRITGGMVYPEYRDIEQAQQEQAQQVRMAEQVIAQKAAQAPLMEELRMLRQALESRGGTPTPTETPTEEEPRAQMKPMALKRNASVEERIQRFTQEDPLIQSIIFQESRGKLGQKSPAGAVGLMQLKKAAAKDMNVKDRTDPEQNLTGGTGYYRRLEKMFGDEELALAAFNWGMGNVGKKLKELERKGRQQTWGNVVKHFGVPSETIDYVKEVLERKKEIAQDPTGFWTRNLKV